jgi:hypothetical protein
MSDEARKLLRELGKHCDAMVAKCDEALERLRRKRKSRRSRQRVIKTRKS